MYHSNGVHAGDAQFGIFDAVALHFRSAPAYFSSTMELAAVGHFSSIVCNGRSLRRLFVAVPILHFAKVEKIDRVRLVLLRRSEREELTTCLQRTRGG